MCYFGALNVGYEVLKMDHAEHVYWVDWIIRTLPLLKSLRQCPQTRIMCSSIVRVKVMKKQVAGNTSIHSWPNSLFGWS